MITDFKIYENKKQSNIVWGIFHSNIERIMRGVSNGEDINTLDGNGISILIYLSRNYRFQKSDFITYIYKIIELDADWNIRDKHGKDFIDYLKDNEDDAYIEILKKKYPEKYKNYITHIKTNDYDI